jgi:hypothetical protein
MATHAAFRRRQARLRPVTRGIAGARVVPTAVGADAGELEGGREINWHFDGAREGVRALAGVDGKGCILVLGHGNDKLLAVSF